MRVLAAGQSQSARRLNEYIRDEQPRARVIDGFLLSVWGGTVPDDLSVPVIRLLSESELSGTPEPIPQTPYYRLWEVAGSAHVDTVYLSYQNRSLERDFGQAQTVINSVTGEICEGPLAYSTFPRHYANKAALHTLNTWVSRGKAPPLAPLIERSDGAILRDDNGNAKGGMRLPYIDVPTATYSGTGGCLLIFGHSEPFTPAKLTSLYGTPPGYAALVSQATRNAVSAGYVLQADAPSIRSEADAFTW